MKLILISTLVAVVVEVEVELGKTSFTKVVAVIFGHSLWNKKNAFTKVV